MPKAVSKRQWRFMQAILHGKAKSHERGTPPKSVAGKYSAPGKDAPEQEGSNSGGTWGEKHHAKAKEKVHQDRIDRKKKKAKLKKSFDEFYKGRGAGCLVVDKDGKILLGRRSDDNMWATPGGHVEPHEEHDEGALRELREEAGIVGKNPVEIYSGRHNGNDTKSYLVQDYKGKVKSNGEMNDLKWFNLHELPFDRMRDYASHAIKNYMQNKGLHKSTSLKDMMVMEELEKNIIRAGTNAVTHEIDHGQALSLVGNGAFRLLREAVKDMKDEDFKDVKIDNYILSIRKHVNDVYSGRISDGHKVVHQFTNRSLPALTAELMSVFEWYLPEDEKELQLLDEGVLADDAIEGGINELVDHYKRHNISNIYSEMENIREEIRHGAAVDLQQIEGRIMSLFDKLEEYVHDVAGQHNKLTRDVGSEIELIEGKIRELQSRVDELGKKPVAVEAYSQNPGKHEDLLDNDYCYLTRPSIEISPNGKIRITFGQDWNNLDQENFLKDMKAKAIKKARLDD